MGMCWERCKVGFEGFDMQSVTIITLHCTHIWNTQKTKTHTQTYTNIHLYIQYWHKYTRVYQKTIIKNIIKCLLLQVSTSFYSHWFMLIMQDGNKMISIFTIILRKLNMYIMKWVSFSCYTWKVTQKYEISLFRTKIIKLLVKNRKMILKL